MSRVHYCDNCGHLIDAEDPVYARRRYGTRSTSVMGPLRKFHRACLDRLVDYVEVEDRHGPM